MESKSDRTESCTKRHFLRRWVAVFFSEESLMPVSAGLLEASPGLMCSLLRPLSRSSSLSLYEFLLGVLPELVVSSGPRLDFWVFSE